jgi:hypothetical protein
LGMLSTIMRPMLAAMDGRDFRNFMEAFLRYADNGCQNLQSMAQVSSSVNGLAWSAPRK